MGTRPVVGPRDRLRQQLRPAEMYSTLVQDQGPSLPSPHATQSTPLPPLNNPTPKQTFLSKSYDEDVRRADSDQRGIFRTLTNASPAPAPGLVRLLGASSFSLPTVERTLMEMEGSSSLERSVGAGPQTSGARQV